MYQYNSSSNYLDSQTLIAYSKQSGSVDEIVPLSLSINLEYLIIVEEVEGNTGSYTIYVGP